MKHAIYPEKQGTPTATSEDANYPATNLLTDYRKEVWKASNGVSEATLRIPISANAEVISLHNTNATTAVCTITLDSAEQSLATTSAIEYATTTGIPLTGHGYSENDIILLNGTVNYDNVYTLASQASGGANEIIIPATYASETFDGSETTCIVIESTTHILKTATRTYDRFWQEYTNQTGAHTATITLTASTGSTVEAGIVRAGELLTIRNPYNVTESKKDFSIKKSLRNGAIYTKKLDVIRTFSYSLDVIRETEFRDLVDLYDYYGPDPFAMLLTDGTSDENMWCVFGAFDNPVAGSHNYPSDSNVGISITEAV